MRRVVTRERSGGEGCALVRGGTAVGAGAAYAGVSSVGSPAASHWPIASRLKSSSTTIDDAPMTPASPPSDERWISRSRVASGSERR